MSKKKSVLFIIIALILGIAIGIGSTFLIAYINTNNSLNGSVYFEQDSGKCGDNLTWKIDMDTRVLTISGTGDMYDFSAGTCTIDRFTRYNVAPWMAVMFDADIDRTISVVIEEGVTSIGNNAFNLYSPGFDTVSGINLTPGHIGADRFMSLTITSISIPDSVTKIGSGAFGHCSFGDSDINIPNEVNYIGSGAYDNTESSGIINISAGLTSFNPNLFDSITVNSFNVDENNAVYSSEDGILFNKDKTILIKYPNAKEGSYYIPDTIQKIQSYAFYNCKNLTDVTADLIWCRNLESIGDYAFAGCTGMSSFSIPRSVTSLGSHCFENSGIKSLYLTSSITDLGDSAFNECTLKTVVFVGTKLQFEDLGLDFGNAQIIYKRGGF